MSNANTSVVFKRNAFAKDNGKGESVADWTLTSTDISDLVHIVAQPVYTVPIIFVPGIMGSNLKATQDIGSEKVKKDDAVWLMNTMKGAADSWGFRLSVRRQQLLNPATTDVFDGGDVPGSLPTIGNAESIRSLRFWGEVGAMSYSTFLVWLEEVLNKRGRIDQWRSQIGRPAHAATLLDGQVFPELADGDLKHAADIRFPVYVCGYNWLQSNDKSAKRLKTRIEEVINSPLKYPETEPCPGRRRRIS